MNNRNFFSHHLPAAIIIFTSFLGIGLHNVSASPADLKPFTSDGCSLFPDGSIKDRVKWCDCCLNHDISYWQGGTADRRKKADRELRACVELRTKDKVLAETMYLGVRAGGHPAFPTWYRWGYGWNYGRGYATLTDAEKQQVKTLLDEYYKQHPDGYCRERHPDSGAASIPRPAHWAQPVPSAHLKNFYKLDDKVYRSAQPDKGGFHELASLGIRNVLSFRDHHADEGGIGFTFYDVGMDAGAIEIEKVVAALRIIKSSNGPILIHCWHGSDRTGLVSAMYRIVFQGWSRESAIDELIHGGYGYHAIYKNIPEFIQNVDIDLVRKHVLSPEATTTRNLVK